MPAAAPARRASAGWLAAGVASLALSGWIVASRHHLRYELDAFAPPRQVSRQALQGAMLAARDVRLAYRVDGVDVGLAAWFLEPSRGAVVIVAHGTGGSRAAMAHELNQLAAAGLGVLALDFPGHGGSGGTVDPAGQSEALASAVAWLEQQPRVRHLGALGFSMGGSAVLYGAARSASLEAVAVVGGFSEALAQVRYEHGAHGFWSWVPPVLLVTAMGVDWSRLRPVEVVGQLSPRPLFIVHGTADPTVPVSMAGELYAAAGEPKTLWRVDGGGHTGLWEVAGPEYDRRLAQFFVEALQVEPEPPSPEPGAHDARR